ncbi:transcriptional regulator [Helicobacter monodelphidis]|uniref:ATP-binding protein n=1 Tax=Helicobacter sp. 15-1451 TaxID=2004995 RepID=UPI000DCCE28D|nr:ATP-binding protein [Helicobacter sp. 15-1451]RAX57257.1 transcriptional regulator [Helicobacter sp. 15-1451]
MHNILKQIIDFPMRENEYIEFKHNNKNPQEIGEYISVLSSSATLCNVSKAYLIYGINDNQEIIGTDFKPKECKKGNEELESWLHRLLEPNINFVINEIIYQEKPIVIFEIDATTHTPIKFSGREYIRIGSYKKPLNDYPEKERLLWQKLSAFCFENDIAKQNLSKNDILNLLDTESFLKLTSYGETNPDFIIDKLMEYKLVVKHYSSLAITNLGAILFAKNLDNFSHFHRKRMRVIKYKGNNKLETEFEQEGSKGYATGFQGLIKFIINSLPKQETIKNSIRQNNLLYPEIAIRELVANALIHQDFSMTGTNPMVEIFDNRIEITNNGTSLVEVLRLIDCMPKSRNETLARLMRILGICEERGSGIDKVISYTDKYQLPAPIFRAEKDYFKAILLAPMPFDDMDKEERIRATYQHCCLKFLEHNCMTNSSLRQRFNLGDKQHSKASKIISDTLEKGLIKPADPENKSTKHIKYIPFFG